MAEEFDFKKSWTAYTAFLAEKLGREPTSDEIKEEMGKWGWEFEDVE